METANFAARLKRARSERGLTQGALASASGIAGAQISRYELGDSTPRSETIAKLASTLGVAFDWLANGQGPVQNATPQDVHYGEHMDVSVRKHPDGGSEIIIDMDDDTSELFRAAALERGMSVNDYLKDAIMFQARERLVEASKETGGVDLHKLAAQVKELLEADDVKPPARKKR